MSQTNDFEPPIDPRLNELLEGLRPVPARDPEAEARGLNKFISQAETLGIARSRSSVSRLFGWFSMDHKVQNLEDATMANRKLRFAVSLAAAGLVVLLLMFGGAGMTVYASQAALPGDALYPVKTTLEQTQVNLSLSAANQAQLHLGFAQRRLDELASLISEGRFKDVSRAADQFELQVRQAINASQLVAARDPVRAAELTRQISETLSRYSSTLSGMLNKLPETVRPAVVQAIEASQSASNWQVNETGEVEFTGVVESIAPTLWTISGKTVGVTPETEIEGTINISDTVKVEAFAALDGSLTAHEIKLVVNDDNANANENENANINENANSNLNENENNNEENENEDGNGNQDENDDNEEHQGELRITGTVEEITAASWKISGHVVAITPQTEIVGAIKVGDPVVVRAMTAPDGSLTALSIKLQAGDEDEHNGNLNENENDDDEHNGNVNINQNDNENEDDEHNGNVNINENDDEEGDHENNANVNANHNGDEHDDEHDGNSEGEGGDD